MRKRRRVFSVEGAEPHDTSIPERRLLRAVIERAVRDLSAEREERQNAVNWFNGVDADRDVLSYQYICETLELSAWITQRIRAEVSSVRCGTVNLQVLES